MPKKIETFLQSTMQYIFFDDLKTIFDIKFIK